MNPGFSLSESLMMASVVLVSVSKRKPSVLTLSSSRIFFSQCPNESFPTLPMKALFNPNLLAATATLAGYSCGLNYMRMDVGPIDWNTNCLKKVSMYIAGAVNGEIYRIDAGVSMSLFISDRVIYGAE